MEEGKEAKVEQSTRIASICDKVFLVYSLIFYGLQVLFGYFGLNTCEAEPIDLGVWLLVAGCTGLVYTLGRKIPKLDGAVSCAFCLFAIPWFIVGGVVLFSDASFASCHTNAENQVLWGSALFFWLFSLVSLLVGVCCSCCLVLAAAGLLTISLAVEGANNNQGYGATGTDNV